MASIEFRKALKTLRLNFKLSQSLISTVAGIDQTEYSAFETGKKKLDLDSANNLSTKIWGVRYTDFVAFSNRKINISKLPAATRKIIKESENVSLNDSSNLLANALDKLIKEGFLNTPTTSKLIHDAMGEDLKNKNTSEITSLLGKPPRNKIIASIGGYKNQKIYIHHEYKDKYSLLTKEELISRISKQDEKVFQPYNNEKQ